tara:strand:+ start:375 stop:659 length:285 start_codon:yes stop_codon:yes gene_type:complete
MLLKKKTMKTMSLPKMVEKVSSMVENKSINTVIEGGKITISTIAWEFNFELLNNLGIYVYDSTTIVDGDLDIEFSEIKKTLMREIICSHGLVMD